jgi:dTDP-glucose pyrophosphorylase
VFTTSGTYPFSFVTQIIHDDQPSHGGDREIFEVMTSTLPKGTLGSVASLNSSMSGQTKCDLLIQMNA